MLCNTTVDSWLSEAVCCLFSHDNVQYKPSPRQKKTKCHCGQMWHPAFRFSTQQHALVAWCKFLSTLRPHLCTHWSRLHATWFVSPGFELTRLRVQSPHLHMMVLRTANSSVPSCRLAKPCTIPLLLLLVTGLRGHHAFCLPVKAGDIEIYLYMDD